MAPDRKKCPEGFVATEQPEQDNDVKHRSMVNGDRREESISAGMGGSTCLHQSQHGC